MFKIGVFGIIFDGKRRVLLCHRRDYDLWNLPGGGLEKGEVPWEGVVREVREETGLEVEVERLAGVYAKPDQGEVVFSFVCTMVGGELRETDEADRLEYFEMDKLPRNTSPKQVERIRDVLKFPDQVVMKVQKGPSSVELVERGEL
jgi:ADP-ribose pyrophosphatase YjhB (NUDIX family)